MKVLFVASELTPIAKVGGLGDVIGALPKALVRLGIQTTIILPYYKWLDAQRPLPKEVIHVQLGQGEGTAELFTTTLPETRIPVLLVKHEYFYRDNIYEYPDDSDRFAFLSAVSLEHIKQQSYDIIHCNDWMTGLIPLGVHIGRKSKERWADVKTLLTIHNVHPNEGIGYLSRHVIAEMGFQTDELITTTDVESDSVNLLAQGVAFADGINTVSETHAREILTPTFGGPIAPLFKKRQAALSGILNGIDTDVLGPSVDPQINTRFSAKTLSKKVLNKRALEKEMGWGIDGKVPMFGMIARLFEQKGADVLAKLADELHRRRVHIVVLGAGDHRLEQQMQDIARRYQDTFRVFLKFDAALAQRIYAGADMFLMPSRFEPCGLGQMISMRYGTLPIVHKTGGLADTVQEGETGFVFSPLTPQSFLTAIERALSKYNKPTEWRAMQMKAMAQDFSWDRSAKKYLALYRKIVKDKNDTRH